jgi:alpha-D-xyloside xylohydrolase
LNPYIYAAAKEATVRGIPILRHPALLHPTDANAIAAEFDYYYGPSLYVAPVVRRGEMERKLWLPPGAWIDWWTLAKYDGAKTITRDAPLDVLPLFLRAGGIVPMLDDTVQTLAPDTRDDVISAADVAGVLDVRAAVDATRNTAEIVLVDGTTLSVQLGTGAVTLPSGLTEISDEGQLKTCEGCGRVENITGVGTRLRITTQKEPDGVLNAGALGLTHGGTNTRVRWDVIVIDG